MFSAFKLICFIHCQQISTMSSQKVPSNLSLIFHVFAIIFVLSATKLSRHEILAEDFSDDSADLILTEEETVALESLRSTVADLLPEEFMYSDFYLIRWLRIANLNLEVAEKSLLETVRWREENNISAIRSEDWSEFETDFRMDLEGFDIYGRPVASFDFGAWDLRSAANDEEKQIRLQRYLTYSLERGMYEVLRARNESSNITRGITIIDAANLGLRQHLCSACRTVLSEWISQMETHYPKFLRECIVVNAPRLSSLALTILRPFMSSETREKLKVFNWYKETWTVYLDERIDKSQRTERYGGTKPQPSIFSHPMSNLNSTTFLFSENIYD